MEPHELFSARAVEMILTKSIEWKYENEFRIVSVSPSVAHRAPYLLPDGDYFKLPRNALKSVIARCASETKQIETLVNKFAPGLPVKRAVTVSNKYEVTIQK